MKHLKLYEDFNSPLDDSDEPAYYVLKNGKFLYFWEESAKGMAGEPMGYYVYRVGDNTGDKPWEKAEEVSYKDIKGLLKPEDLKQHEEERKDLGDSNASSARSFVE